MKAKTSATMLTAAIIACFSLTIPVYGQNQTEKQETEVTCMAENPKDGSLWMGTAGNGLYRLSKTGSRLHFGASQGKLGSDNILYICFDSDAKLWILGAGGSLSSYTAKDGFRNKQLENPEISSGIYLPKKDRLMLASVTKFYSFDPKKERIESEASIPFPAVSLKLSSDSTFVWIFGDNKVARLADDGSVIEWSGVGGVSDLIPLEFETYSEERPSRRGIWFTIIICVVIFGIALTFVLMLGKRRNKSKSAADLDEYEMIRDSVDSPAIIEQQDDLPEPAIEAQEVVETPANKPATVTKSKPKSAKKLEPVNAEFTTRIMMLIDEHYTEPDFDVDAIAALVGMSRIHVNRKLKAEGSPSPSTMIRDRRMDVAKYYLLQSEMPMAKIASECGFRSASYFTTAFKDYTGLTPSEFVAQNKL